MAIKQLGATPTDPQDAASKNYVDAETTRAQTAEVLAVLKANNLSDLPTPATARTNLGLGYGRTVGSVIQGNDPGVPIICTSSTHPVTPLVGMTIYETNTGSLLQWQSATTGWTKPWNLPWGMIGYTQTNSGSYTTSTALSGSQINFTAVTNRNYKFLWQGCFSVTVANSWVNLGVFTAAGAAVDNPAASPGGGTFVTISGLFIAALTAGASAYKLEAAVNAGIASIAQPVAFTIEDIGPNGVPA